MKNVFELEGVIDIWDSSFKFKFLNRSIPSFSKEWVILKPKEKKLTKMEAPFIDEISGLATVKMLDSKEQCTVVLKLKFIRNQASLDITNNTQETVIFDPKVDVKYFRYEIFRILQNKIRCITTKSE